LLSFWDPREVKSIAVGQTSVPLAGDFTTPYAYLLAQGEIGHLAHDGMEETEDLEALLGLYLLEPYDPDKIPIVMVHGIRSSALAWMELTNDIHGDSEIRDSYQVWQYVYPTSRRPPAAVDRGGPASSGSGGHRRGDELDGYGGAQHGRPAGQDHGGGHRSRALEHDL
jgi:hypothetical protein